MRFASLFRRRSRAFTRAAAIRNALVVGLREANGPFHLRVKPGGKLYRRHPKHRLRALADAIAA